MHQRTGSSAGAIGSGGSIAVCWWVGATLRIGAHSWVCHVRQSARCTPLASFVSGPLLNSEQVANGACISAHDIIVVVTVAGTVVVMVVLVLVLVVIVVVVVVAAVVFVVAVAAAGGGGGAVLPAVVVLLLLRVRFKAGCVAPVHRAQVFRKAVLPGVRVPSSLSREFYNALV